jgi:uncharacterized membrane protein
LKKIAVCLILIAAVMMVQTLSAQDVPVKKASKKSSQVSFRKDVFPLVQKHCLPCHAEDNFNPSELSLDSYELLRLGGKHGDPVVPGKSKDSILLQKLGSKPPFGDPMPLDAKKKKGGPSKKQLSEQELKIIAAWIDQGAKDN